MTAPAAAGASDFELGVAAGQVTPTSAVLWAKAKSSGTVTAEVATDKGFKDVVASPKKKAKAGADDTVQAEIAGLRANRTYFYRFCAKSCSDTGTFRTSPNADQAKPVEFAFTGGTDAAIGGGFSAFRSIESEGNAFNVHLGDTIYSNPVGGGEPALTVEQKWAKYRENLADESYSGLRGSAALYSVWGDQEFTEDFTVIDDGVDLYEAGVKAFRDYSPVNYSKAGGLYDSYQWGQNLEVFVLDERSFRSDQAYAQCVNTQSNQPDLMPTAPTSKRTPFAGAIPSLSASVATACRTQINFGERTILGRLQLKRFLRDVERSEATWKVVLTESPFQQYYVDPYDRWEGYSFERVKILKELQKRGVQNLAFLSTGAQAGFANLVRLRTYANDNGPVNAPGTVQDTPYTEYAVGPDQAPTYSSELDALTGSPGIAQQFAQGLYTPAPPTGVGMSCAQGNVRSYAQVRVTQGALRVAYKDENGDPVVDVNGQPCGPYSTSAQ